MKFAAILATFCAVLMHKFYFTCAHDQRKLYREIDLLKAQIRLESEHRDRDYEHIMSKLDDINNKLDNKENNMDIVDKKSDINPDITDIGTTKIPFDEKQLKYLMKGMNDEKRTNGIMRQKIKKLEESLNNTNDRLKRSLASLSTMSTNTSAVEKYIDKLSVDIRNVMSDNVQSFEKIIKTMFGDKIKDLVTSVTNSIQGHCDIASLNNNIKIFLDAKLSEVTDVAYDTNTKVSNVKLCKPEDSEKRLVSRLEDLYEAYQTTPSISRDDYPWYAFEDIFK
ncbi:hypothetical protein ACF0H5_021656 [Mactra antiquata]